MRTNRNIETLDLASATEWYAWVSKIQGETVPEYDKFGNLTGKQVQAMQLNIATTKPDEKDAYMGKVAKNDITKLRFENKRDVNLYNRNLEEDPMVNIKRINCPKKVQMPKDMSKTFMGCFNLEDAGDLKNFDTSKVKNMDSLFDGCKNLKNLDLSNWEVLNVTKMQYMFWGCKNLVILNVSNWNTSNVISMWRMFCNCKSLIFLDVSNWDTSSVMDMEAMFRGCCSLEKLDTSNWNVSKTTDIRSMFYNCPKEIIPSWYED